MMINRTAPIRRALLLAALLLFLLLAARPAAAGVALSNGEPDPSCPDLRLWLRADAGIRDAAGHGPADPDFNGLVASWNDQSGRHFDLAAQPEQAPSYVPRQAAAGNRPTVAFGGGRMLGRPNDGLHEQADSTTLLVLQVQRGREQGSIVFCAGDAGGRRETLSFERNDELDPVQGHLRWIMGEVNVGDPLRFAADGRFAIVILRASGESSCVQVEDGLGDALGADREMNPTGHAAVSNQCGGGYCLGGAKLDQPQTAYEGQVAEVMVYKRGLSSAERRALVAYLRRKYELDVLDALCPSGTLLLQAEDFDGDWQVNARWDQTAAMCLGQRHVNSKGQQNDEGIKRTVVVLQPGSYAVWVRAMVNGRENALRTSVGGKRVGVTHAEGPMAPNWQLAGKVDLQPGETEVAVRGEGPGRKECDAVLVSPTLTTLAGVEEFCALAWRLRQAPGPGQLAAVFEDGRRIEGSLVLGWRGSGTRIVAEGPARPAIRCLLLDGPTADTAAQAEAVLEFHNGDRMRGTLCGYVAGGTEDGGSIGPQVLVLPGPESGKAANKPVAVAPDWLRRIVFDAPGPSRRCPPRSLVCRDGRVIAFRALRFSQEGVSLLTEHGLMKLAYRELAEVVMPPMDVWEAYHRQLAQIDPQGGADVVRLETGQGMVFTASATGVTAFRDEAEAAASTCLVEPAWSHVPIPVAWSAVRTIWRAPADVVPLSRLAPDSGCAARQPGQQLEVAGQPQRGRRRAAQRRRPLPVGLRRPRAQPTGVQPARGGAGLSQRPGNRRRGGRFGLCRGKGLAQRGAGQAPVPRPAAAQLGAAVFSGDIALPHGKARQLVLAVESGGGLRGLNADPLDIGDHADWLEPVLLLDPAKLRAAVERYRLLAK